MANKFFIPDFYSHIFMLYLTILLLKNLLPVQFTSKLPENETNILSPLETHNILNSLVIFHPSPVRVSQYSHSALWQVDIFNFNYLNLVGHIHVRSEVPSVRKVGFKINIETSHYLITAYETACLGLTCRWSVSLALSPSALD